MYFFSSKSPISFYRISSMKKLTSFLPVSIPCFVFIINTPFIKILHYPTYFNDVHINDVWKKGERNTSEHVLNYQSGKACTSSNTASVFFG